jgi:hypothetical protein
MSEAVAAVFGVLGSLVVLPPVGGGTTIVGLLVLATSPPTGMAARPAVLKARLKATINKHF